LIFYYQAAAIAKAAENTTGDAKQAPVTSPQQAPVTSPQQAPATGSQQTPLYVVDLTGDPEKDKRIKNLTKVSIINISADNNYIC